MSKPLTVTFLGTGTSQGIPVIGSEHPVCKSEDPKDKRLRVSVLISWGQFNYVIDTGPDFRAQMLEAKCTKLDGILFTHEHNDHIAGLDDIRPYFFRQGDIRAFAHKRVFDSLKNRFDYIFVTENKYPGAPTLKEIEIDKSTPFKISDKLVIPIEVMHNRMPVLGFRIEDFTYITDAKTITKEELAKIKGTKVLVLNALRQEAHYSHFNLEEALDLIKTIAPDRAYLTHISHLMGFHEEVQKSLPKNVFLAYDGLQITI
ncbi:MBL fold metallo-hydrolase [Planktosalinus lacus]|uniref:MBL fold metallo-hydrolase n=1 Tax=Planktosalinus lacus TaxID=1526573 RepID=A0A8J2VD03_9FLAO|nr:MBL fold metallo-hydrolase [Planktosalinus lacus]GGD97847.1 MBL fold metallo-hydrolase [Planktosalinus lacus]